jgi:hypothetical protein
VGFNTSLYRYKKQGKKDEHWYAVERIYNLAEKNRRWQAAETKAGRASPDYEVAFPEFVVDPVLDVIGWPMDVCLTIGLAFDKVVMDIEVDGKDHERGIRFEKDAKRDRAAKQLGIIVVRIDKSRVIGKNALTDEQLSEELGI